MKHVSFLTAEWRWQTCQRVIVRIKWDHSLEEWSQKDVSLPCYLLGTWYSNQYFSAKDYLHFQIGIIQYFTGFLWEPKANENKTPIWHSIHRRPQTNQYLEDVLGKEEEDTVSLPYFHVTSGNPWEMGEMNWGEHYNKIQVLFSDWLMHQSIATYSTIATEKLAMSYTPSDSLGSLTLS